MPTVLDQRERTARKAHGCDLCGKPIPAGSRYVDQRNVMDGQAYNWREHTWCDALGSEVWDWLGGWRYDDEGMGSDDLFEWLREVTAYDAESIGGPEGLALWNEARA